MDWIAPLIMPALGLFIWAAVGSADALARDPEAWTRAGYRRSVWGSQVAAGLVAPIAAIWTGYYFFRVKSRVFAAEQQLYRERWPELARQVRALDGSASTVRLRTPMPVMIAGVVPGLVAPLSYSVVVFFLDGGESAVVETGVVAFWALLILLSFALNRRFGVTLTVDDAVINGIRRRHLRWADVTGVFPQSTLGSRFVRIWTRDGRSYRLRAPITIAGIGRTNYERDFHRIGQWWWAHRQPQPQES